mgnify:CR=1 FL=1
MTEFFYWLPTIALLCGALLILLSLLILLDFLMERRRSNDERLNDNETRLRILSSAIDQSPVSIVVTDKNRVIEYVNNAFVHNSGYRKSEVLGKPVNALQSGRTTAETYQSLNFALSQGGPWCGEFVNRRKDGELYVEAVSIAPVRLANGTVTHYIAVKEDITEKRRLIEELEQQQQHMEALVEQRTRELSAAKAQAELASETKSAFVANISHEIRTPLTAIIGFSESLLADDQSLEEREMAVHTIIRTGRHLQGLINDILDLSKIEADRIEVEQQIVSLPDLFRDISGVAQVLAREKRLAFSCDYVLPLPVHITGDVLRIKQVLINLIGNACKFTPSPGTVGLSVSLDSVHQQLTVAVQDSGIGIASTDQERLFQPFTQADSSTSRRFGGTGLGLSISRSLARLMGGDIKVISEQDAGSLFLVTFATGSLQNVPLVEDLQIFHQADGKNTVNVLRPRQLKGRVLVAEDNGDNQRLISLLLRRTGVEFTIVANGLLAVETAQAQEFDLVLIDMQMPLMGGLEATELLRYTGFSSPIIVLTANAGLEDREKAKVAGCSGFLTKPIDQQAFYETLYAHLPWADSHPSDLPSPSALDPEMEQLRHRFHQELPRYVWAMELAYQQQDWEQLSGVAHQIKGNAATFGLPEATRLGGAIESQVMSENFAEAGVLVQKLVGLLADLPTVSTKSATDL